MLELDAIKCNFLWKFIVNVLRHNAIINLSKVFYSIDVPLGWTFNLKFLSLYALHKEKGNTSLRIKIMKKSYRQ